MTTLNLEPIQIVEIDIDYCSLVYGESPCTAALGTTGVRKCYNTFATCQDKPNFNKTVLTQRFIENRARHPKCFLTFPVLKSVSVISSTVNIAGSDDRLNGLGRRATITVELMDFPYGDRATDKYVDGRKDGTAQTDEGGYNPEDRGTYFTKLKARFPFYAGRPLRVIEGFLDETCALLEPRTTHYVMTDIKGPDNNGRVIIEAKDILSLADDKKAVCPRPSLGKTDVEVEQEGLPSFSLTPEGIGNLAYPTSGFATLGREVVSFTRVGDVVALTGRALRGTRASSHRENSTFQIAKVFEQVRIDDAIEDLLVNFGNVPQSFIPKSEWEEEITFWYGSVLLDTVITKPEGVSKLVSELSVLGISVWWDEVDQKVRIKVNAPFFEGTPPSISDRNNIKKIEQEQRDEDRVTQIHFYSRQTDPTGSSTDKNNFDRITVIIDAEAEQENSYREPRIKEIYTRWLDQGADSVINITALRLLKRFNTPPVRYTITMDAKDRDFNLVDVVNLESRILTDVTGKPQKSSVQIYKRQEIKSGHEVVYGAQRFEYDGKYGRIAPNGTPNYLDATDEERARYVFLVDPVTLTFPDGEGPFLLI